MIRIKRKSVKVNGINIFYQDTLSNKQSILCLHGKYGRSITWNDFIKKYMNRFRIIAPDQRGHGLSDKPIARYAGEDFSCDAYELIKMVNSTPAIVVGHSIGGRNAAYLAALYPEIVKCLIILDAKADGPDKLSSISPDKISPMDTFLNGWQIPYASYNEAVNDIKNRFNYKSNIKYFLDSLYETSEGYDFLFSRYAMSAIDIYYQGWYNILKQIKCPVLLVRAKNSWYLSSEEAYKMKSIIKNCTYFEVSNSDHMVYADNQEEFYPVFEEFINKNMESK